MNTNILNTTQIERLSEPASLESTDAMPERACVLAILANTQTPYRLHFHRRIVREMPEVKLWSLFTHEHDKQRWPWVEDREIGTRCFGWGDSVEAPSTLAQRLRDWRKGGRIIEWLHRHRPHVLLVLGYADVGKVRVLRWARRQGIPTMMFMDSNIYCDRADGLKRVLKQALLRRIFSWCDALLICGSAGEAYLKRYGVPECKIVRSPYEPNYDLIQNIAYDQVEKVRRKFGLVDGRRRLVYCGRLSREKRVDVLLRAFSRIVHERPLWDLLLIGDGPLRNELPSLIPGLDSDRVVWTGFQADAETIAALYKSCDVLVIPSDHEPWGLVVNEAVAAGLAVVASDVVGAARDLVQDGLNGMFFRPGDEDALVHALVRVTSDNTVDRLKIGSATVLKRWRKISDPVNGLRDAMRLIGALSSLDEKKGNDDQ